VSASYIALSGSYNTFSGSASTRTTQIENVYATTGSNSFRANQSITGSLVVSSTITAQTLVVQTVTSSIVYSSGSNNFGNQLSNNQTFTGSVNITGSLNANAVRIEKSIAYGIYGPDGFNINAVNTSTSTTKAGNIAFTGYSGNGASPYQWGFISGEKDSATGDGSYAGSLTFYTTSGGAGGEANSANYKRLTISGTGAATFASSVDASQFNGNLVVGSATVGGKVTFNYGANVVSKSWIIVSDAYNYGDLGIQQSTTQTGSVYTNKMILAANGDLTVGSVPSTGVGNLYAGAATFSNQVNAESFYTNDTRYISNQIMAGYNTNAEDSDIWINYTGYQGGTTRFRDFRVGNGKQTQIAFFDGSTGAVTFSNSVTLSRPASGATLLYLAGSSAYGDTSTLALCDGRSYIKSTIVAGTANGDTDISFGTQNGGVIAEKMYINTAGRVAIGGQTHTFIDYTTNTSRFYGGSSTNTFGLGAANVIYYQGDASQFYPTTDNTRSLGTASYRYTAVYATSGTVNSSDLRQKKNIAKSDLGMDFINKLNPVKYNWIEGDTKTHYGLIAQEIESLNVDNFGALYIQDDKYGLNYSEFIAPMIKAIQELSAKVTALETK
jgi:hypothetical protein